MEDNELNIWNELENIHELTYKLLNSSTYLTPQDITILSKSLDSIKFNINLNENQHDLNSCGLSDDEKDANKNSDNYSNNGKSQKFSENHHRNSTILNSRSLRRTTSESNDEAHIRGILKYPRNWTRRSVSESNCDIIDCNISNEEEVSDENEDLENKSKKCVRFNDHIYKTTFRRNSSILGRKNKNKKRAQNRAKGKKITNGTSEKVNEEKLQSKEFEKNNKNNKQTRARQDSGYDSDKNDNFENSNQKTHS